MENIARGSLRRGRLVGLLLVTGALFSAPSALALSVEQFRAICTANGDNCRQTPVLNAYVGGALDMIATLDEQTDYLGRVYCREPKLFFNVPAIIDHVANAKGPSLDANAMMLVLDYLVSEGRC